MNTKTIGSAIVIVLAAIVGLFLGAAMNDGLSGSILLVVIAGFVCVIIRLKAAARNRGNFYGIYRTCKLCLRCSRIRVL